MASRIVSNDAPATRMATISATAACSVGSGTRSRARPVPVASPYCQPKGRLPALVVPRRSAVLAALIRSEISVRSNSANRVQDAGDQLRNAVAANIAAEVQEPQADRWRISSPGRQRERRMSEVKTVDDWANMKNPAVPGPPRRRRLRCGQYRVK
jgi:hypothetical protein